MLAVELFETADGVLVNELAMRPHNSGHWTIEGSRTSQFEQHLRAVLDYPLGDTAMTAPVVGHGQRARRRGGRAGLGGPALDERIHHFMAHWPDVKLHWYGKGQRPGRKLGHVTALGETWTRSAPGRWPPRGTSPTAWSTRRSRSPTSDRH